MSLWLGLITPLKGFNRFPPGAHKHTVLVLMIDPFLLKIVAHVCSADIVVATIDWCWFDYLLGGLDLICYAVWRFENRAITTCFFTLGLGK